MKKRVLSLFLAITLCLSLTPTGALAEESLPEPTVAATQETETPTPAPQKEEPQPGQTVAATQETETPTPAPQKEESQPEPTVAATQETEPPTPAPQKEEPTAPAENGADENASPASPDEKPTENTPAAAEKNPADEEPGKEPAAATGKDESKADGSPSDDDAAKVQNRLVMAAAAGPGEPTMMGQNNLLALADEEQNAAEGENSEGGGLYVPPGGPTEGGGGTYIPGENTQTEIWCTSKPSLIQRGYDGTADGSTITLSMTFTDGTKTFELEEKTDFTATKTFDSADAGRRTVTVEIKLIGDAAAKYKLKAGQETFTIGGIIDKATPDLTVSLSKEACTVGEKILSLLSVSGVQENAAVTYYYTQHKPIVGDSDYEGNVIPAIDANTAISEPGTYYVYAKTAATTNYEEYRSETVELTVSECDHGGKNGFDGTNCPDCGVAAVAETGLSNGEGGMLWRRFANLQTAIDADRDGGAEFRLLTDVTGDYTIDGTQNTALDLKGHSIKGTVTVKGTKGDYITTTLSNTKNTTTASIDKVVACDGAELAGSGYPAVIGELTLAEGATWNNILNGTALGYKVLKADGTHKWYAPNDVNDSQLNNVIINSLPITSNTLYLKKVDGKNLTGSSPKVERGTTVQLCASCNANGADVYIYTGEIVGNNEPTYSPKKAEYKKIGTSWYYVVDLNANTIGTYDIYFTASKDGYKVTSAHKTLKVTKATIPTSAITAPTAQENLTYTGQEQALITAGSVTDYGTMQYSLTKNGRYSQNIPTGTDAGKYTVWYRVFGDANHKDTAPASVVVSIGKKPLPIPEVTVASKTYDGTTNADITDVTFDNVTLNRGTDYTVTASFDDAGVGDKNVTATVTLMGQAAKNYALEQSNFTTTASITKATIDPSPNRFEQTVFNDLAKTYEIDLKQFLDTILPEGGEYGDIKYGRPSVNMGSAYYPAGGAKIGNGKLRLSIKKAASIQQGKEIGTVTVQVETTNYQTFTLTIHVIAQDKVVPVLDGTISASEITYGQTLADSTLTVNGTMQDSTTRDAVNGTFAWKDGTFKPDAGSYDAEWVFTPAEGYEEYATATGTVTVKVNKATPTFTAPTANTLTYTGSEQPLLTAGSTQDGTMKYRLGESGEFVDSIPNGKDAGTYTVYYKVVGDGNHNDTDVQSVSVTIAPLPISLLSVSSISKTYDGSADVTLTANNLTFFSKAAKTSNIKLPDTALSFSNAQFIKEQADGSYLPSPEVGGGKALSFTMTLASDNYVFEGKPEGTKTISDTFATDDTTRFTITKAAAPTMQPIELTVINGLAKTYLVNLPALPTLGDNCKYGSIKYEACNFNLIGEGGYANSMATITSNDEFQLTVPAVESQTEGSVGTVGVKITTDNYQDMLLTVEVIAKNKIVPVLDGEITATPITFGQILRVSTITGTMKDDGKTVEGTFEWTDPSTKPDKAGDYQAEWTFTPAEGYEEYATATGTVTIKVNKATPTFTAPTAQENLTYTGQEQALITAGSVTDYGPTMQYSLTENGTYSQDIPTGTDAGTYTVWYRVFGDANHNDTEPASVAVRIGQKPLRITEVTAASKTYDGTTNADITSVTFENVILNRGTDYTVTANFDDARVGKDKNITATVTLMEQVAKNYFLEQNCFLAIGSGNITRAAAPGSDFHPAVTVINDLAKTYEMVLSNDYLPELSSPCEYGNVSYSLGGTQLMFGYKAVQAEVVEENSQYKLKLTVPAVDYDKVSSVGTLWLYVSSDNYQNFRLDIGVKTKNKDVPVPDGTISASDITYGQALNDSKIAGKMKAGGKAIDGTFTWTNGTFKPAAGDYTASWTFTPDAPEYATATGIVTVTVNPKAVTVSGITAKDKVYDGNTDAVLDCSKVTLVGVLENDTLTVTATGTFEKADIGKQKVTISDFKLSGASAANYVPSTEDSQTETTATITAKEVTVTITPNGGTYGETITPATVKANDVVGEDTPTITLTYTGTANDGTEYNGTTLPAKAGTYTVTATTTNRNYTLDPDTNTAEFAIAKRPATVTPDNKTKVYEAKDPDLTYAVSGVLDGETLKGITLTRAEGENAGEYAITATADAGANPNYDVTFAEGTLTIEPKSIKGAKVVLGKALTANGAEQTQTVEKVLLDDKELPADSYTVTDNTATAPGRYTLTVTAKGNYTGKIEWTYVIAPAKAEDAPGADIAIDKGTVKLAVKSEGNVPTTTLLTDKAELLAMLVDSGDITADELAQIANGASVDIVLTMKEANVPDEVKAAMAQAAKDYTIGHYLDISLFKYMTVNGSQQADVALHTTKDVLTISVVVPDALINTNSAVNRTYCIVRNHEGTITVLDAAFDAASKTLTFKTDRFSDYAIAYKDTAVPSSGSNPGSNSGSSNSSNDSETKKNEVTAPTPTPTPTPASTSKPSTITAAPQTGDTFHPTLYVVLLVVSLLGLAVVFVCKKRNDK